MSDPISSTELLKYTAGLFASVVGFLFMKIFSKQSDTFTKEETRELIDLKVVPLVNSLNRFAEQTEKQTQATQELNKTLQALNTNIAVIHTRVTSLERANERNIDS